MMGPTTGERMDGGRWSETDVADYLGVTPDTFQWIRSVNPSFPPALAEGGTLEWQRAAVDSWLDQMLDRTIAGAPANTFGECLTPDELRSAIGRVVAFGPGRIAVYVNPDDIEGMSTPEHRAVLEDMSAVLVPSAEDAEPGEYWVSRY